MVLAFLVPEDLYSGIRDFGGYNGRGRGVEGYNGGEEGRDHHVMV